jgi:hypothetical protein
VRVRSIRQNNNCQIILLIDPEAGARKTGMSKRFIAGQRSRTAESIALSIKSIALA